MGNFDFCKTYSFRKADFQELSAPSVNKSAFVRTNGSVMSFPFPIGRQHEERGHPSPFCDEKSLGLGDKEETSSAHLSGEEMTQ
jgi:hypothetical protein